MKKKMFLITLLSMVVLTGCAKEIKKEESKIVENNGMLSYTIDGEKTDIKPSKEDGYIVNKIICDNGSDMMWDNDNWEVELTKINSKDRCEVDFTKDTSKEGYRVTVTSNMTSALDSLSKATTLNGTIKIYSKSTIKSVTGCNGVIEGNKVIVSNVNSNQTCNIEIELKTLADTIRSMYSPKSERTDFSVIDNGTPALYTGTDDQGTTHYFSGDGSSMNNWVSFAGKLWRIIRINGDGSVRLLYAGSGGTDGYLSPSDISMSMNEISMNSLGQIPYNKSINHPAYVGWKYSTSGENGRGATESNIFKGLSNWFETRLKYLINYIDTEAIYCNARNGSGIYSAIHQYYYEAYSRLTSKLSPKFTCSNASDQFKDGFGLMTADEIVYAGGVYDTVNKKAYYYLNIFGGSSVGNYYWWTMTPSNYNANGTSRLFVVDGETSKPGNLNHGPNNGSGLIRPVISLKKDVLVISGDGSAYNPYEVTI